MMFHGQRCPKAIFGISAGKLDLTEGTEWAGKAYTYVLAAASDN